MNHNKSSVERSERKERKPGCISEPTDGWLVDEDAESACRVVKQNEEHQRRTLLPISPVALESEADMILLPAAPPPPPLHRQVGTLLPLTTWLQGGERGRRARPKCFTADVAALPQQPFPIQNWCPDCSTGVYTPAYWSSGFLQLQASLHGKKIVSMHPLLSPPEVLCATELMYPISYCFYVKSHCEILISEVESTDRLVWCLFHTAVDKWSQHTCRT